MQISNTFFRLSISRLFGFISPCRSDLHDLHTWFLFEINNIARLAGVYYTHYVSPSVRPLAVIRNAYNL